MKELTIDRRVFGNEDAWLQEAYGSISRMKIVLSIGNKLSGVVGSAALVAQVNRAPHNGTCIASPLSGYSASTLFTINCTNWIDHDQEDDAGGGTISRYFFYGTLFVLFCFVFVVESSYCYSCQLHIDLKAYSKIIRFRLRSASVTMAR
jgi:hypothetical protein